MQVKYLFGPAAIAFALLTATPVVAAPPDAAPIVTGKEWQQSDQSSKKAYLLGMANLLQVEHAYQARKTPTDSQSMIPRLAKGLQGETLDSVSQKVDGWYAANPSQMDRPVVETIWFEIVVPGTKNVPGANVPGTKRAR